MRILVLILALSFAGTTQAQSYPTRPVRLVLPFAAGGLVDVRYRVIDPAKAAGLMTEDGIMPMLHIADGDNDVVLMPDSHMRTQKLVAGRMYFMLIPNAKNVVKRGTSVIVAFNDIALEPIAAK